MLQTREPANAFGSWKLLNITQLLTEHVIQIILVDYIWLHIYNDAHILERVSYVIYDYNRFWKSTLQPKRVWICSRNVA